MGYGRTHRRLRVGRPPRTTTGGVLPLALHSYSRLAIYRHRYGGAPGRLRVGRGHPPRTTTGGVLGVSADAEDLSPRLPLRRGGRPPRTTAGGLLGVSAGADGLAAPSPSPVVGAATSAQSGLAVWPTARRAGRLDWATTAGGLVGVSAGADGPAAPSPVVGAAASAQSGLAETEAVARPAAATEAAASAAETEVMETEAAERAAAATEAVARAMAAWPAARREGRLDWARLAAAWFGVEGVIGNSDTSRLSSTMRPNRRTSSTVRCCASKTS